MLKILTLLRTICGAMTSILNFFALLRSVKLLCLNFKLNCPSLTFAPMFTFFLSFVFLVKSLFFVYFSSIVMNFTFSAKKGKSEL